MTKDTLANLPPLPRETCPRCRMEGYGGFHGGNFVCFACADEARKVTPAHGTLPLFGDVVATP